MPTDRGAGSACAASQAWMRLRSVSERGWEPRAGRGPAPQHEHPHRSPVRQSEAEGPQGPDRVPDRRRPVARAHAGAGGGAGARRRGPDRTGRAFFGPHRGRSRDPTRRPAGAGGRHHAAQGAGDCRRDPAPVRDSAAPVYVSEPGGALWPGCAGARRRGLRYRWLPADRRQRGRSRRLRGRHAPPQPGYGVPGRAHFAPSGGCGWWRNIPPASSTWFRAPG